MTENTQDIKVAGNGGMLVRLIVERFTTNKVSKTDEQRKEIGATANKRSSAPGVTGKASKMRGPTLEKDDRGNDQYRYEFTVVLEKKTYKSEDIAIKHLSAARKFVETAAEVRGWRVKGEAAEVKARQEAADSRPTFNVPELTPEVMQKYFGKIKERQAHIRLIHASTINYRQTNGIERNHTLLYGAAAACKSSLFKAFKDWYEEDNMVERVMMVNATTLTKAGLETMLLERAENNMLPEILWVNEIEKGTPSDYLCLLSIMDGLAEISRMNAKIGKRSAKCNLLIWADCNNEEVVKNWASGALWSRFSKRYACVRPTRDVMMEIMLETIHDRKTKGYPANKLWAKAAVDYCYDVMKTDDPRVIKSMLDGGDDLLTGAYFKDLEAIQLAEKISHEQKKIMI